MAQIKLENISKKFGRQTALTDLNLDIGYLRCLGKGQKERIIPIGKVSIKWTIEYLKIKRPVLYRIFEHKKCYCPMLHFQVGSTNTVIGTANLLKGLFFRNHRPAFELEKESLQNTYPVSILTRK